MKQICKSVKKLFASTLLSFGICGQFFAYSPMDVQILDNVKLGDDNKILSPVSFSYAATTWAMSKEDESQNEIAKAIGFDNAEKANKYMGDLYNSLSKNDIMKIANSVWCTKNFFSIEKIKKFENLSSLCNFPVEFYKTFAKETNLKIDKWVDEKTNGKIKGLGVKEEIIFWALINAVYFKNDWKIPFEVNKTKKNIFTNIDKSKKEIDFMNNKSNFNYYKDNDVKMVELPYKDNNVSMYVFLPENGDINSINYDIIDKAIQNKNYRKVNISIPKFKTEFELEMTELVKKAGVIKAFTGEMAPNVIKQKTYIDVNENGTEAAAVTAIMSVMGCCTQTFEIVENFNANRPFLYIIRDNSSQNNLFIGSQIKF